MYVETVPNRNSRPAILLREGWREGKRVRKRTLANLTEWPSDKVEALRRLLKGERLVAAEDAFVIERSLPHGHVAALLAMARRLGLDRLLAARPCRERDLVLAMILERLLHPASKLATTRLWHATSLAAELAVADADVDELYGAMDWLLARQDRIEQALARRHLGVGAPVFYDVTSSYYEGRTCPLMRFGHNRDGKKGKTQLVYGVLTGRGGRPVAVEVYPGDTGDPADPARPAGQAQKPLWAVPRDPGRRPRPADRDPHRPAAPTPGAGLDRRPQVDGHPPAGRAPAPAVVAVR